MKPTKEKIIQIFNKALKKAKNKKVNFIAIFLHEPLYYKYEEKNVE